MVYLAWYHSIERRLAGHGLGFVLPNRRCHDFTQGLASSRILDHQDFPALTVTAAGGETCVIQQSVEGFVADQVVGILSRRERRAHDIVVFHKAFLEVAC